MPEELFSYQPVVKDIDILMVGRIVPWKRQDLGVELINSIVKSGLIDIKCVIGISLTLRPLYAAREYSSGLYPP